MFIDPNHKIHIDYPKTERWERLSSVFAFVTYLSILVVSLTSAIKPWDNYFDYVIISEIVFSFFFLIDFFIRWYLSKFSYKFLLNVYSFLDLLSILPFFIISFLHFDNFFAILIGFRLWRVLRLFRLWKHGLFIKNFKKAIKEHLYKFKIGWVFFLIVWLIWSFSMYALESQANPEFETIPHSMRWMATKLFMVWYNSGNAITPVWSFLWSLLLFIWPIFISILTSVTIVTFLDTIKYIKVDDEDDLVCPNCLFICDKWKDKFCRNCGEKLP